MMVVTHYDSSGRCCKLPVYCRFFDIGTRNIQIAVAMMKDLNIDVVGRSVGGTSGRKILFNTETGMVRQNLIAENSCNTPKK